ncbi:transferase family protein [Biscogniauxia mediterranea]|nr:transferase family protein [Biscogniauxia mediterranea]
MNTTHILHDSRVFPSVKSIDPKTTPLSILDAKCARFSPTGAVWLFDQYPSGVEESCFIERLRLALIETLNSFPHLAGQLQWAKVRLGGNHTERFNRPLVKHGTECDPGVEWKVVRHPCLLSSLVPAPDERSKDSGVWIGNAFPQRALLSQTPLALHNLHDSGGLPAVSIQINLFQNKGYAIGIKIAHPLADAQSLMIFVAQWAKNSQTHFGCESHSQILSPVFAPSQLDSRAAGDIDGDTADPKICSIARDLPLHRYDWWDTSAPGYNPLLIPTTENSRPPPEQIDQAGISPSTRAPWESWDLSRPVTYALLHFTGAELDKMKATARAAANARSDISRLDALLAHLFRTVNQARSRISKGSVTEEVYLNVTLDARRRVSPPLPDAFVGSPLFLSHIKAAGSEVCTADLGALASDLRRTMGRFTPDAVAALLHDAAHEASPQRLWQAFVGARHLLATSWLRLPLHAVDFDGSGRSPRYVHPAMEKINGIVQVMDAQVADRGADVGLYLDEEAMAALLENEELRRFRV